MMRRFFTRYSRSYLRSLVYMLQASEYDASEFFAWYGRAHDFRAVEKRKHVEWTAKASALWWILAVFVAFTGVIALLNLVLGGSFSAAIVILLAILVPLLLPYLLVAAAVIGQYVQRPMERRRIAAAQKKLRAHPALKIAIAGSYGKTSMREIVKTVLGSAKKVAAPPGSYNTPLGIAQFISTLGRDEDVIVFELGEYYPGDVKTLCEFVEPDMGIITGVNEAHLQKFGSLEATAATIFELADYLGNRPLYVNGENATARASAPEHAILYTREGVDGFTIEHAKTDLSGTRFTMRDTRISISAASHLLGLHMVGPLAAAAYLGRELGLTVAQVEEGMSRTKSFAHRLEPKTDGAGVVTLDDSYNGNPDGVKAVIEFLASLPGRRFYVTPGLVEMGDKTEEVHYAIGEQLTAAKINHIVLIRNSVTSYIEQGLKDAGYSGVITRFDDGPSAYAALPHLTVAGDIVLLQNDWPDQYA